VIDAFVDALDLGDLGFDGVDPAATGRPAYHPSINLKLYIYGYLNRVQSSRRLEREAGRNVEATTTAADFSLHESGERGLYLSNDPTQAVIPLPPRPIAAARSS
jgi:hypothetical protein